jgi:PKD repeat protein
MRYFLVFIFFVLTVHLNAQVSADFNLPPEACLEEQFNLENNSISAERYEWDFCPGDFYSNAESEFVNVTGMPSMNLSGVKFIYEDGKYYSFWLDRPTQGRVYRAISDSYKIAESTIFEELTDFIPYLKSPEILSMIKGQDGVWVMYIGHLDIGYGIVRARFGNGIGEAPTEIENTGYPSGNRVRGLDLLEDGGNYFLAVSLFEQRGVSIVELGGDPFNTFGPADIHEYINLANVSQATGIEFIKTNGNWLCFIGSQNTGNLIRVNFGNSLLNSPVTEEVYALNLGQTANSKLIKDGEDHFLVIASSNRPIKILNLFDLSNSSNYELITPANSPQEFSFTVLDSASQKSIVVAQPNRVDYYNFQADCPYSSIDYSEETNPIVSYSQSGAYPINLTAYDANNNSASITKEITVSTNQAPEGFFTLDSVYCIADNIQYNFTTTNDIASYNWDFGDGNTSSDISPTHQYAVEDEYIIILTVESAAGCPNIFSDTLRILPEPQPVFSTVEMEYCTFESIDFSNDTPFDFGENVVWSWDFNGEGSSTIRSPEFTFESAGTKTVTLEANVLGCIQTYQSTLIIIDGPKPDFDYDKNCLGEAIQFTNLSTGANIISYAWDFGDGATSTAESPEHIYVNPGDYTVQLIVSNASGCETSTTQNIQIFDQIVDSIYATEAIENLPFNLGIDWSNDFDSSQTISYQWEVAGNIQTNDTATYTLSQGTYTVNLEITNASNCVFMVSRPLEVQASETPTADFNLPSEVCMDEQFELQNASVNSNRYKWDFCTGDFYEEPNQQLVDVSGISTLNLGGVKFPYDEGMYYSFWLDRSTQGKLYRVRSSSYTLNSDSEFKELESFTPFLKNPEILTMIQDSVGHWIMYIGHLDVGYGIVRAKFGNGLSNPPTSIENIDYPTSNRVRGLRLLEENGTYYLAVSLFDQRGVAIINLGSDPYSTIEMSDITVTTNLSGVSQATGIDLVKVNKEWLGFIGSQSDGSVTRINFGNSLLNTPIVEQKYAFNLGQTSDVKITKDGENFFLIAASSNQSMEIIDLGDLTIPSFNEKIVQSILPRSFTFAVIDSASSKSIIIAKPNTVDYYTFQRECSYLSSSYSEELSPNISYSQPGTYPITLTAYHPNGNSESITKEITVTENQAPEIAFAAGESLCVSAPIQFSSESNTEISSYSWDFGDGNTSSEANPAHLFSSAGEYLVQLSVSDTAGCNNLFQDSITVYAEPQPDFQTQVQGSICSQKPVVFENITTLPTTASFQWDFGDGTTSTEENPEHIYASEGEYIIHFQIEMAGCLVEKSDTITVNPGPLVDFNYSDDCFGQVVNFENSSTGDFLQSFQWDFGDGTQSTQLNPNHSYDSAGTYQVALTALTSNGCDYTFQKDVIVHPVATVAFEAEVGCANQPLQFNEQVALQQSNITDYLWDFDVSGTTSDVSTEANPEFTFPSAGTYEVSLQVTTADGCTTSGTQTVLVNALPQPAFRYEDNCLNNAILFSPENTENIVAHFWELQNAAGEVVFTAQSENFSYTFENAGTYQLRYRQQNENLCSNSITETIEILPLPEPDFQVGSICANEAIFLENLTDLKGNTVKSYSWSINEAVVSTDFRPQYTFEESGDYQIALQVETQNGCIQTVEKTISVSPAPVAFFELEQSLAAFPYTLTLSAQSQGQTAVRPAKHNTDTNLITIKSKNSTRRTVPVSPLGTKGLVSPLGTPAKGWPASGRKGLLGTEGLSNFQLPTSNQLTIDNKQLTNRTSQLLSDTILSPFISTYFNNISTKSSAYKHTISSNTQHPTPYFHHPTPNTQHPSSNITWTLNNDTISSTAQLNHTITQPGTYLLGLILTNEAGCTDSHYEQIRIRKPNLDIALSNLRITQDQDFTGFVLNISNRGTLVPQRLDLEIDLGGYAVTETIEEPLLPEQNRNVALGIKLTEEQIRGLAKICIRAIPHNDVANETYENNNRVCTNIETGLTIMEIYPNPVVTQFTLPIILPENAVLSLSLEQSNGQNVKAYSYDLEAGYHEIQLERGNIKPGIYFLRIRYQGKETVKKIIFQ